MPIDETCGTRDLTLVLGGARSGKSRHAEALVRALPPPWLYIATGEPRDNEMAARIAEHRARRNAEWQTIEAPRDLVAALTAVPAGATVLVDCLTLWLSNVMLVGNDVDADITRLEGALVERKSAVVLVGVAAWREGPQGAGLLELPIASVEVSSRRVRPACR